ncbi:MAG TPA: glycosyltransferase [Thermoanaerobaculia bacterium]|nr:glycosyltransferase [Thermoanaerobaculia bacterium]
MMFSVVVCTRDRPAELARCLAALSRMEHPAFEVIVVDNAPRDDSVRRIVAQTPHRYVREERPGLDRARNRGIAEARHGLIAFTDDDTEAEPGWLAALAGAFADPRVAGVTVRVLPGALDTPAQRLFEQYGNGMSKGERPRLFDGATLRPAELLRAQDVGVGANMVFRREALEAAGGFDPALDVGTPARGAGDLDLFHRLLRSGAVLRYEPEARVRHHHRRDLAGLRQQIRNNGRSYGVYLLKVWRERSVPRPAVARFALGWCAWLGGRLVLGLLGRHRLPLSLLWAEVRGAFEAPSAFRLVYSPHGSETRDLQQARPAVPPRSHRRR